MKNEFDPVFITPDDGHYFFGYYDKSAIDKTGRWLLANKPGFIDRMPARDDFLPFGVFDLDDISGNFIPLGQTRAWNWQQGSMLQWLGPDHSTKLIYNDRIDGEFVSVVMDMETRQSSVTGMAVYTVSPCGRRALCIDHERLCWFRKGYSYEGINRPEKNTKCDPEDGIWLLDIESGTTQRIIRLGDLLDYKRLDNMTGATHYIEHLMFSPDGSRFQFLHRWLLADGGLYTRLFVANVDGSNLVLLNDTGRMTHCCWRDNETVLGWGAVRNSVNSLRRFKMFSRYVVKPLMPLYRHLVRGDSISGNSAISRLVTGDGYLSINVNNGATSRVLPGLLDRDGHPSVMRHDRNVFVTDTYVTPEGTLDLMLCDISSNDVRVIDRLKSMPRFDATPLRCDLHPKLSFSGNRVAIDTMHDNRRSIHVYNLDRATGGAR